MRLCVTLVYPGVPLQSRMKICRNNIIVYTPCKYIDRAVEVSIVNEYSDVALRIVSIVNDSYRGVAQTSNASSFCIHFVLLTLEKNVVNFIKHFAHNATFRLFNYQANVLVVSINLFLGCSVNRNYNHNPTIILRFY